MKKSDSIKNLMVAVGALQAECIKIKKDSTNPHFKSKYASLPTILDEIQPVLTKHNLAYTQVPEGGKIITLLMHTESGEWIESEYELHSSQQTPQAIGSAITYARRYSLTSTLGLNIDDDDDGNAASAPAKQKPQNQAPQNPFVMFYPDPRAITATLAIAKTKEDVVALYNANRATVDGSEQLKAEFSKVRKQMDAAGKVIITDKQFSDVKARVMRGDLKAAESAKGAFLLNEAQAADLQKLVDNYLKLEAAVVAKYDDPSMLVTIVNACYTEAQVNTLHKNNSMIMDRDQLVAQAVANKLKAFKVAA